MLTLVDQNSFFSSSCGKLKVKLRSRKIIDHFNLSYPVLAELVFLSDKNRAFNLDSVYCYSECNFSLKPGEKTAFSILLIYLKRATTAFFFLS